MLPQPLPLPREPGGGSGSGVLAAGAGCPLPSPGGTWSRVNGEESSGVAFEGGSLVSAAGSKLPNQTDRRSNEPVDAKSTFRHYRNLLQDPDSVNTINFRLNIPAKSAPSSGFSSPTVSPRRCSPRRLSNVEFTYNARGHQVWSAPEVPSADMLNLSPRTSPEKILGSPSRSPRYSPVMRSPARISRNPSAPPSPLHPKLFPEGSVAWHNSNGSITVHPLPLPPGPSAPSQSGLPHQTATKPEVSQATNQWQKGKLVGSGTFGNVYIATNKHTGALCAMKEVNVIPDDPKSAECLKQLEQEIELLSQLKHPNIVQYYGSERIEDQFYIYLEYVYPGSINKYLHEHCGAMTESVVRNFTGHILKGLAYLHSTNTVHRDIKGANLLVDAQGVVKLADFGMAKHLSETAAALSLKGTPHWMAPEVLQATMNKDVGYDLAVDIWSLGCTIIEMFTGKHPWSGLEGAAAMFKVLHKDPHIPETLSSDGKNFLQRCFRRNPAERPTASMLLEHPFIQNSHHYNVHGSIQSFARIKLVEKQYSPKERKTRSVSVVKAKQLSNA